MSMNSKSMSLQHSQQRILENFIVIWLDSNINETDADCQDSINQLRRVINSIKTFVHIDECIDYLNDSRNEKAFMIVSGTLGQQLVSAIHNISQLYAIYVFCGDKTTHEQWIEDYHKVKGVFTQIEPLCDMLKRNVRQADMNLTPISIVSISSAIDLNQLDQSFMYSQLLKEILLKIKYDEKSKNEFVEFCRVQHADNNSALRVIDEFERDYDPSSPILWYTRDCFIYPMLNKALRTQDIEIILKMGFFVRDLHRQIEHCHSNSDKQSPFPVYRGQGIFKAEFQKMQHSEGNLLSFNNFLSTSIDEEVSHLYADSARGDPKLTGVLFQIEIDPSISTTPFARLDNGSYFSKFENSEKEVLFSMHTVFRIGEMEKIANRLWKVELTLTRDNDERLKRLTNYMRKEIGEQTEWGQLALLMLKMGELNKAEEIYKAIHESAINNDLANDAQFHNNIGYIMTQKGDQNTALSHIKKALEMQQQSLSPNHLDLATSHNNIGAVHHSLGEYSTALSHFEKALKIQQKSLPSNHPDLASLHSNIGGMHQSMGQYSTALSHFDKALEIQQQYLPSNHPNLATSHNNIGWAYQLMGEYSIALSNLKKALEISQQSLPPNHPNLAMSYNNIGTVHQSMGEYSTSLSYFEKVLEIRQKSLPTNHSDLAMSHNNIGAVHQSMGEYSTALSHHEKALEIRQKSLPSNHPDLAMTYSNIASVHQLMGEYSTALSHHEKTLKILHESLPPNHPDLARSYSNIALVHQSMGEYSNALLHHEKALEIRQKFLPPNYSDLAISHNNLGLFHKTMEEYLIAFSHLEKALQIWQESLPPTHPNIATAHNNIASVHQSMGKYSAALSHFKNALEIWQQSLLPNHPNLAIVHSNIAAVCQSLYRYEEAVQHALKAALIASLNYGPDHPQLQPYQYQLKTLLRGK